MKQVFNGAICYTPDGSPIIGPAWGLDNFWLNEGHSFGITAAGGAGFQLAEWIVEGEPTIDMMGVDPRRFGDYATRVLPREEERGGVRQRLHHPLPRRGAPGRAAVAHRHRATTAEGAGRGVRPEVRLGARQLVRPAGGSSRWTTGRSGARAGSSTSGASAATRAENVGLLDMSAFAKCRMSGPGAEAFLDRLVANRIPARSGPVRLVHALNTRGGVLSEFTVWREGAESFYLVSAGAFQRIDHDWIRRHAPRDGSVRFENLTGQLGVLVVAGPKSRELLARVTDADLSNARRSRGSPAGGSTWASPRASRCGSTTSASWDGSCTIPSSTRTTSSMRSWRRARDLGPCAVRDSRHGLDAVREVLPDGGYGAVDRVRGAGVRASAGSCT